MRFFLDENFPVPLIKPLRELGHDAVRVTLKSPDPEIAERAKNEGRVILIRIHPPDKDVVFGALKNLFASIPEKEMRGLIVLEENFHLRTEG